MRQAKELGSRFQKHRECGREPRAGSGRETPLRALPGHPSTDGDHAVNSPARPVQTLVLRWILLCGTEMTETIFLIPGSFLFFLSDKTGRPYVPPVYSYTHRYNKISLNIKEKTQRYTEYMCISNPN